MKCQLCEENEAQVEHHVEYEDWGTIGLELVINICNSCHHRIHDDDEAYYEKLNPIIEETSEKAHDRHIELMASLGGIYPDGKYTLKRYKNAELDHEHPIPIVFADPEEEDDWVLKPYKEEK